MDGATDAVLTDVCRTKCHKRSCKGCVSTSTKIFLVVFNLFFLVFGVMLAGLGLWMHSCTDELFYTYLLNDKRNDSAEILENIPFLLIGIGGFIAAMSFLGCCGTCAESVCFLGFYDLLLLLIISIEIIIGSLSSVIREQISAKLSANMQYQIQLDYNGTAQRSNNTTPDLYRLTLAWDTLQIHLNCCGAFGPQDFLYSSWFNHTKDFEGVFVPPSCCALSNSDPRKPLVKDENLCQVEAIVHKTRNPITQLHTQGCHPAVDKWIRGYEKVTVIVVGIVAFLQMVNFLFACVVIVWVRRKHSDYSWCENDDFD